MRVGYSMAAGEMLSAEHAEYGDCAKHQIVCPSCREAVFKGVRAHSSGIETHYFSHYHADAEEAALCEMRVAALAKAFIASITIEGRGQHLRNFMQVFRDGLAKAQAEIGLPVGEFQTRIARLMAMPYLNRYAQILMFYERHPIGKEEKREHVAQSLLQMPAFSSRSPFWARRQASFTLDMMRHLETPQTRANRQFLAAAVFVAASQYPEMFKRTEPAEAVTRKLDNLIHAIGTARPAGAVSHLEKIWQQQSKGHQQHVLGYAAGEKDAAAEIEKEMNSVPQELRSFWLKSRVSKFSQKAEQANARAEALRTELLQLELMFCLHDTLLGLISTIPFTVPALLQNTAKQKELA